MSKLESQTTLNLSARREFLKTSACGLALLGLNVPRGWGQSVVGSTQDAVLRVIKSQTPLVLAKHAGALQPSAQVVSWLTANAIALKTGKIKIKDAVANFPTQDGANNLLNPKTFLAITQPRAVENFAQLSDGVPGLYARTLSAVLTPLVEAKEQTLADLRQLEARPHEVANRAQSQFKATQLAALGTTLDLLESQISPNIRKGLLQAQSIVTFAQSGKAQEFLNILKDPDSAFTVLKNNPQLLGPDGQRFCEFLVQAQNFDSKKLTEGAAQLIGNFGDTFRFKDQPVSKTDLASYEQHHQSISATFQTLGMLGRVTNSPELTKVAEVLETTHKLSQFIQIANSSALQSAMGMSTMAVASGYIGIAMTAMSLFTSQPGAQQSSDAAVQKGMALLSQQIKQLEQLFRDGLLMLSEQHQQVLQGIKELQLMIRANHQQVMEKLFQIEQITRATYGLMEDTFFLTQTGEVLSVLQEVKTMTEVYSRNIKISKTALEWDILNERIFEIAASSAQLQLFSGSASNSDTPEQCAELMYAQVNRRRQGENQYSSPIDRRYPVFTGVPATIGLLSRFANQVDPFLEVPSNLRNPLLVATAIFTLVDQLTIQLHSSQYGILDQQKERCRLLWKTADNLSKVIYQLTSPALITAAGKKYIAAAMASVDARQSTSQGEIKASSSTIPHYVEGSLAYKEAYQTGGVLFNTRYRQFLEGSDWYLSNWDVLAEAAKRDLVGFSEGEKVAVLAPPTWGQALQGKTVADFSAITIYTRQITITLKDQTLMGVSDLNVPVKITEYEIVGSPYNGLDVDTFFEKHQGLKPVYHGIKAYLRNAHPGIVGYNGTEDNITFSPLSGPARMFIYGETGKSHVPRYFYTFDRVPSGQIGPGTQTIPAEGPIKNLTSLCKELSKLLAEKERRKWRTNELTRITSASSTTRSFSSFENQAVAFKALTAFTTWYSLGEEADTRALCNRDIQSTTFASKLLKSLYLGFNADSIPLLIELHAQKQLELRRKRTNQEAIDVYSKTNFSRGEELIAALTTAARQFIPIYLKSNPMAVINREAGLLKGELLLDPTQGDFNLHSKRAVLQLIAEGRLDAKNAPIDVNSSKIILNKETLNRFAVLKAELISAEVGELDLSSLAKYLPFMSSEYSDDSSALKVSRFSREQLLLQEAQTAGFIGRLNEVPWGMVEATQPQGAAPFAIDQIFYAAEGVRYLQAFDSLYPKFTAEPQKRDSEHPHFCPYLDAALARLSVFMQSNNI